MYQIRNVLRLCRTKQILRNKRFIKTRSTDGSAINAVEDNTKNNDFSKLLQNYKDKIEFSSYLEHEKLELGYFKYYLKTVKKAQKAQKKQLEDKKLPPLPVALQYYVDKDRLLKEENEEIVSEPEKVFQLPFAEQKKVEINDDEAKTFQKESEESFDRSNINKWMTNYEHFDDTTLDKGENLDDQDELSDWSQCYGTPDPNARVSRVPCGGCGALLHCSDPAIPGYLPSEIMRGRNETELKLLECQRCHFLKEYNIALDVSVQPEEYEKLLQTIKYVKSLIVYMVDLLDFPCSIWPGIVDIIGKERPIIIVGNKVDLLPGDSIGYIKRIKESLMNEINKTQLGEANIRHVSLISAKTGYGVEDLISAMFKHWLYKGHVYLVGCTNVGKSSLFNALLQSDYCKVHAVDIVKRATVSRWPGTTLNLLKFPINRPSGWKIYQRTRRLKTEAKLMKMENEIRKSQLIGNEPVQAPSLIGHIGRTFSDERGYYDETADKHDRQNLMVLDEKHELFANSKWFYDTPGVVLPDQVISLLSTEELLLTIPKRLIRPQTYYLQKGQTFFIGGLARVDLVYSPEPCRFTIFCSESLPITVTKTADADLVYEKFLGTELFAVPTGGRERLENWPGLQKCETALEVTGGGPKVCSADIVLSSIGWVSVTAKKGSKCVVSAWTPQGRGVRLRNTPVLPFAVNLKGKRLRDTPAYMVGTFFVDNSQT